MKAGKIDSVSISRVICILGSVALPLMQNSLKRMHVRSSLEVLRLRPASAKGTYVRSITLSTSMGPPVSVSRTEAINIAR